MASGHAQSIISLALPELTMTYLRLLVCSPSRCQETFVLESDTQREEKSSPCHSILCQYAVVGSHDGPVLLIEDFGVLHQPISMFGRVSWASGRKVDPWVWSVGELGLP